MNARTPRIVSCLLFAALVGGLPAAGVGEGPGPTTTLPAAVSTIQHHVLDNGLEVVILPEPGRAIASVQLWYGVGSRDETEETRGFAHLVELLMFAGTETTADFRGTVRTLGGRLGSATWPDVTLFYADVPADQVERILELEADRLLDLKITDEAIEFALTSIGTALARAVHTMPHRFLEDRLRALAYGDHPYANPAIGLTTATAAATVERCRSFHQRYYRPDNACLIIVGGVETEAVLAAARRSLGTLHRPPSHQPIREPLPALTPPRERRDRLDLGFDLPSLAIAYPIPGDGADELTTASLRLLAGYLRGPGRRSVTESIVDVTGQAEIARLEVDLMFDEHAGLLLVLASFPDPSRSAQVEERLLANLAQLAERIDSAATSDVTAGVLAELRAAELHQLLSARSTTSGRASALGNSHMLQGNYARYDGERALLGAVDWPAVARAARFMQPAKAVIIALGTEL
jgi:zinc protease